MPRFRLILALLTLLAVGLRTVHSMHAMNGDGVSYVEIAYAYADGRWADAVNAYWSPLYSWLLALPLGLVRPSAVAEYPLVHAVGFVIIAAALAALHFFTRSLLATIDLGAPEGSEVVIDSPRADARPRRETAIWLVAHLLFTWVAYAFISVELVTPDWCAAALFLVACGLALEVLRHGDALRPRVLLGVALGLAYLAKAALLPVGAVLALCVLVLDLRRRSGARMLVAPALLAMVALPWAAALSAQKGRVTLGDTARLNYAWYVASPETQRHWQGWPPGTGTPAHPTRRLGDGVRAFEFASPVPGTYPAWYDPSYWNEGLRATVDLRKQVAVVVRHAPFYTRLLVRELGGVTLALLLLGVAAWRARRADARDDRGTRRGRAAALVVMTPCVAAMAMYALVHTEERFLGGFLIASTLAVGVTLLARVRGANRLVRLASVLAIGWLALRVGRVTVRDLAALSNGIARSSPELALARALDAAGVRAGARVAVVGGRAVSASWARLARVRIVAEVPRTSLGAFIRADAARQEEAVRRLFAAGAHAVVLETAPTAGTPLPWRALGASPYGVLLAQDLVARDARATRPGLAGAADDGRSSVAQALRNGESSP